MLQLRISSPPERTREVVRLLEECPGMSSLAVFTGNSVRPPGDLVTAEVARESVEGLIVELRGLGIDAISLLQVDAAVSRAAEAAEAAAPGEAADAVIWAEVIDRTDEDSKLSWAFVAFLTLAVILASIAVVTDSAILVIGAMVVGPEFGPLAAIAVGVVHHRFDLVRRAAGAMAVGVGISVVAATVLALLARSVGWVTDATLARPRPATDFIWTPDRWSFIVAFVAGIAGTLSLTSAKSTALTGVFISVTTVPALGNFALALALWVPSEMAGTAAQFWINLGAIVLASLITLSVQTIVGLTRLPVLARDRPAGRARRR